MKAGTAHLVDIALPPQDGTVASALSDLEIRLAAWTAAARAVQARFSAKAVELDKTAQAAGRSADVDAKTNVQSETAVGEAKRPIADASSSTSELEPAIETPALDDSGSDLDAAKTIGKTITPDVVEEPQQGVVLTSEPSPDCLDEDETLLQSLDPETAEAIRARYKICGGRQTIRELIQANEDDIVDNDDDEEEESLLLALDDEVAETIRVQYRLFNGRKTIRELIEEHETDESVQPERTSWWRR